MAIYTPAATRRRRVRLLGVAALLVGAVLGGVVGRLTAPTVADRVEQVRGQAAQVTAQLRVLSIHAESNAASLNGGGDAGAALGLRRADDELSTAFAAAPWIPPEQRADLHNRLVRLAQAEPGEAADPRFGAAVDQLAADIDRTFGNAA
jgi:hypothetical protein